MFAIIVYDIEHNSARNSIAKLIERKGGVRLQKSVFLIELNPAKLINIQNELREIQQAYPNEDTILIIPIDKDNLTQTVSIGVNKALENIINEPKTLFF